MSTVIKNTVTERKNVTISRKRQFTIPASFFEALGFEREAECMIRANELVIRPIKPANGGEFAEEILADLIANGFEGEALLSAFREKQAKVTGAIHAMRTDAKAAAEGKTSYSTYDDIFGSEG